MASPRSESGILLPRSSPSGPGELAKQMRQAFGGYPHSIVSDGNLHVDAFLHGGHPDSGPLRRGPGRIRKEVAQHLGDAAPVRQHPGEIRRKVDLDASPVPSAQKRVPGPVHQDGHIGRFGGDRQRACLSVRSEALSSDSPQTRSTVLIHFNPSQAGRLRLSGLHPPRPN